jgi:putative FmdB family regulatory protein
MPIYEFRCADCGHVSELIVGIGRNSDDPVCGSCGGSQLEKQMSVAMFSVNNETSAHPAGSTCCGGTPSSQGCTPGSCCGSH